jgi:hypothetical protein
MRRFRRLASLLPALPLLPVLPLLAVTLAGPASAAPARLVTVRVVGLNRDGLVVKQLPAVFLRWTGQFYRSNGQAVRVQPGGYLVGAAVPTGNTSETLVVRHLMIRKSETITLNAEHGTLVRVALTGVTASQESEAVSACLEASGNQVIPATAYGGAGVAIYAVPVRSASVGFSYQASWQGAGGAGYDLTGSRAGGIPGQLSFRQSAGQLARLSVAVRAGVNPATAISWAVTPGNYYQSLCSYGVVGAQTTEPFATTQYVTPGQWTTNVDTFYQNYFVGFNYLVRNLAGRHSYRQAFGAAAAGPGANFPAIDGNIFRYDASDLADTPGIVYGGDQCCVRSMVTLRTGGHVVTTAKLNEWRGNSYLQKVLTKAGWYTFDVSAARWNPHGTEPAGLLSNRVTLAWRFHVTPVPPAGVNREFPVTVTTMEPRGLSALNQAKPGATTTLQLLVVRAGQPDQPAARYPLTSVRVLASVNGGATWQTLTISRQHGYWLATVHDPPSGYVALRSVVTDAHGDRSVETIYRAYGVS